MPILGKPQLENNYSSEIQFIEMLFQKLSVRIFQLRNECNELFSLILGLMVKIMSHQASLWPIYLFNTEF